LRHLSIEISREIGPSTCSHPDRWGWKAPLGDTDRRCTTCWSTETRRREHLRQL